jgi:hypothetical protein
MASINEQYYEAPENFHASEVLDNASDSPSRSAKIGTGSWNTF